MRSTLIVLFFSTLIWQCSSNTTVDFDGLHLVSRQNSQYNYGLDKEDRGICFDGNGNKTVIPLIQGPDSSLRFYTSRHYLISFQAPEPVSRFTVYECSQPVAQISPSEITLAYAADWVDDTLISAYFSGNIAFFKKIDKDGSLIKAVERPIMRGGKLYTGGRISTLIHDGLYYAWVPIADKVFIFDFNLNQFEEYDLTLPTELSHFRGEHTLPFLEALDSGDLEALREFLRANKGKPVRCAPTEIFSLDDRVFVAYETQSIHAFLEGESSVNRSVSLRYTTDLFVLGPQGEPLQRLTLDDRTVVGVDKGMLVMHKWEADMSKKIEYGDPF